ncbi:MAG: hypothetical protein HN509_17870 [Halobacteriovoraceae bacterium]|mgnify:CR=1 FL=1|jgi:hypothetical protein|nr:hypothetical protein [Halobacteriovoraceae bacterium]MBT5094620.1 hypothetical protein [Halobacteriovoraceae bacterium]
MIRDKATPIFALLLTLLIPLKGFSITFEDAVFPELAPSGRALAMGNAYVAKVDDSSAVFYNPAGLGSVRHKHLHLSNFHFEMNKGWMKMGTSGSIGNAGSNFSKGFDLDGARQLLLENRGRVSHSRFHALPNFTSRFFSAGYLYSKVTRATINFGTSSPFEFADRTDHGPYGALNLSLFGGIIKTGASVIFLNRKELVGTQTDATATFEKNQEYNKGNMLMITAGSKVTLPIAFLPTFAATLHNASDQGFSGGSGLGAPDPIKQTLDLGFSLTPQIGKFLRLHLEANYKDIGNKFKDVDASRKILLGMEFDIARTFFFRFGYGDGFGSGGVGLKTKALEFDLTTYAVDAGPGFRDKEDRRFSLTLSSGF